MTAVAAPSASARTAVRAVGVMVAAAGCAALAVMTPAAVMVPLIVAGGVLVAARPPIAAALVVGILFSNMVVLAVQFHNVPGTAAAVVPLLLCLPLAHILLVQRQPVILPATLVPMIAFLAVQIAGTLASRDPQASSSALSTYIFEGLVLFVLLVNVIRTWSMVRVVAVVLVVTAGSLGLLTMFQEATGTNSSSYGGLAQMSNATVDRSSPDGGKQRHAGPVGEQNRWAQALVMVLPVAVALAFTDPSRSTRVLAGVSTVGLVSGIVLTYSRGAAVGVALTVLVAVLARWISLRSVAIGALVTVVALVSLAPVFVSRTSGLFSKPDESAVSPLDAAGPDGSVSNRAAEGTAALAVFAGHPIIGVGGGLFPTYFQDEARRQGVARIVGVNREAHSLYLGLAAETGALGLAAFGACVGVTIAPLARLRRRLLVDRRDVAGLATGYSLALVGYLATGIFLHLAYARYFWMVLALAAATAHAGRSIEGQARER